MKYLLSLFVALLAIGSGYGQQSEAEASTDIESLIESRQFEFVAESANPMRGRTIFLSPGYTLTVQPDSLVSFLPYYGRAYQANMDPSKAGIKFNSTDFEYVEKPRKKRRWEIEMRPKDVAHSPQVHLWVHDNGQASMRVTLIDRESIAFQGYIRKQADKN